MENQKTSTNTPDARPRCLSRLVRHLGPIDSLGMAGRIETYASEEVAFCSCGEQINIVHDSDVTNRMDRIRLRYPDDTEGWCAFRCRNCHQEAKPTPNAEISGADAPKTPDTK